MSKTGIIILAAGNAHRMGKPKQLLQYGAYSFVRHVIEEAKKAVQNHIVVVLGAYSNLIQPTLQNCGVHIAVNNEWQTGMAGSIKTGLHALLKIDNSTENIIFAVADQPFISADIFNKIQQLKNTSSKNIIASAYSQILGTPVLFNKKYFSDLLKLQNEEGAKKIIKQYSDDVGAVPFAKGVYDIDTEDDFNTLQTELPY